MADEIVSAVRRGSPRHRIRGLDLARGLALFGMIAVHVGPTDIPGAAGRLYAAPHGRASLLFVLVAGVGVSLLDRSRSSSSREAAAKLGWRAVLLLPAGLVLQELDHGVNVILQSYALLFLVAILAVQLPDRWLLRVAGGALALGPVAFLLGRGAEPGAYTRISATVTDPPGDIVHALVLSGPYPLVVWIAPFLVGLWLGRRDLSSAGSQRRLLVVGGVTALIALFSARTLVVLLGTPRSPGDLRFLATSGAHSQMPLWLLGGTAAAVFVLGVSLRVAGRWPRATWPLQAVGQLALTAYVLHLVVLQVPQAPLRTDSLLSAVGLVAAFGIGLTILAVLWRRRFHRGPLELLLRPDWLTTGRLRAVPGRERAAGDVARR
ncbi:MAG: DUF418 domain-containing protein [Nitriliruptoraceae bacterium]